MPQGWGSLVEAGASQSFIPFDIRFSPAPILGSGSASFVLTDTAVGKLYGASVLTGTPLSSLTVLSYSTYLQSGNGGPTIQIGWDDDSTDGNTGWRGRIFFAPTGMTTGAWQTWDALDDTAGKWYTTLNPAFVPPLSDNSCVYPGSTGCTWSEILAKFPNAIIHNQNYGSPAPPNTPIGFAGVKAGSNATGVSHFDGFTIGTGATSTTYNFEPTYSTITVTPAITNGWASFEELSGSAIITPIAMDIQSVPTPALGIGTPRFELTQTNVGKLYGATILTGTKFSDLLVLSYKTFKEPGGQIPTIQIGWDDNASDLNSGFRGRLVFVPTSPATNAWEMWNALSDTAGVWFTTLSGASACPITSTCTWSQVLANYPNAIVHDQSSVLGPYGFVGVKAGSGGTGVSYFDGLTLAANQNVTTYDLEPDCSAYRVFNVDTTEGFCSIQAAIDDSDTANGHTISVTAGVYAEVLTITKGITLTGMPGATIIPPFNIPTFGLPQHGALIWVDANNVTIRDLTIDGDNPAVSGGFPTPGGEMNVARAIYIRGPFPPLPHTKLCRDGLRVENMVIHNVARAVNLYCGSNHIVQNNQFFNLGIGPNDGNYGYGVLFHDSANGIVAGNTITNAATAGVFSQGSSTPQPITFTNNVITNTGIGLGVNNFYGNGNALVQGNTVYSASLGMQVTSIQNGKVTIQNNTFTFTQPEDWGFSVWNVYPNTTQLLTNTLSGGDIGVHLTDKDGTFGFSGAVSNTLVMRGNSIQNANIGVQVSAQVITAGVSLSATNNTISGSVVAGVQITGSSGITSTLSKNFINNNANGVLNSGNPANVTLNRNDLSLNTTSAISNANVGLLKSECNWFGSNAGPGASVLGNVDFNPWLVSSDLNGDCSPATLVVEKVVTGNTPFAPWQFASPTGTFTLPATGGSITLTGLDYGPTLITETTKLGYVPTSSCTNGATGGNVVTPTLLGSSVVTCTFTNSLTPVVTTQTVKYSQPGTWVFFQEGPTGSGAYVAGPATPPLGTGSAQLTVNATGRVILLTPTYTGTRFADITTLSYSTYVSAGNPASTAPVLQLNVDYNLTDVITSWQGRLTFEPYMSGTVTQDVWQTWNPLQGKWYASAAPGNTVCPQNSPCTWSQVLAAFPNAGINANVPGVQFRAGGPWAPGFTGHVDAFTIGVGNAFTTFDFEPETPCTTTCYVDAVNGNDLFGGGTISNPKKTIQAAIDTVAISGTVRVLPGTYSETASNRFLFNGNGPYQFGLFFPDSKPGISVIGVTASDAPITSYATALATVNTNATNNFGPSNIFVEGDNITLQGLRFGTNSAGLNKTIEVIGDNFTLRNSDIADPEGSVYINDFRFDSGTNTSRVKSYTIDGNYFDEGVSLDLASGAGFSGPVSGRQIINNVFDVGPNAFWPAISFNGSGTGVPWFTYGVGGAVIQGNTFNGSNAQYIRTRGTVDVSQFDWTSYWNDNTYDKGVMVVVNPTPPYTPSVYTYTAGGYTFTNVSAIFATIQDGVDVANAGDTVLVKSGTYTETVTVGKPITVAGDGANVKIQSLSPGVLINSSGVTLKNLAINGTGSDNGVKIDPGTAAIGNTTLKFITVTNFNNGVYGAPGNGISNVLIEDSAFVTNTQHGIYLENFNVDGVTVRRVNASFNNAAGGNGGRGLVIWNGTKKNITVEDSTFNNNGLTGIDLNDGEAITVSITNNTVMNNRDAGISTLGLRNAVVQSNTVTNNGRFGMEIKNSNGDGTVAGPNRVLVQGNTVSRSTPMTTSIDGRDLAGIAVIRRAVDPAINPDVPAGVVVRNNTVSGFVQQGDHEGFGIVVEGIKSNVYGNTVSGNEVGLQVQQSSGRGYPGNNDTGSAGSPIANDNWFDRGNAQQTCLNVGTNSLSSNSLIDYREVGSPSLYRVFNMDTNEGFCTIQAAIDDANTVAGNTISVTAGTYVEQVVVNKTLTLIGAGKATTFIKSPATLSGDVIGASLVGITNTASVTMTGLTVTGPKDPPLTCAESNALMYGVRVMGGGKLNLSDSSVIDIRDNPLSGCQTGIAVRAGSAFYNQIGHLTMTNVVITGYQKGGVIVSGPGSTGIITGNTIIGYGNQPSIAANGVQISSGAVATVTGNTISANKCDLVGVCAPDPITGTFSSGVLLFDAGTTLLTGNIISDTDAGIYSYMPTQPAVIENNTLLNNRWHGVYVDEGQTTVLSNSITGSLNGVVVAAFDAGFGTNGNSVANIYSNTISGANNGVLVVDSNTSDTFKPVLDAQFNTITGNMNTGINIETTGATTATVKLNVIAGANGVINNAPPAAITVNRNNLASNTTLAINNTNAGLLKGECNWFGSNAGPGTSVLGNVDFNPWLTTSDLNGDCSPATLVIEKVVTGATPFAPWQFAGPTGTFTLPAAGGSITLTGLDYGPTPVTETVKPGFVSTSACTSGATGGNVVTPTLLGSSTVTCTFTNAITLTYSTITVTPAMTQGWGFVAEPSPSGTPTPLPFDLQSLPAPTLGIGSPAFNITDNNVGKMYGAFIYTGTRLSNLLVLSYSTYLAGGPVPAIQLGWDDNANDANTGFRGRLVFVPNAPASGTWQTWNALSDTAGTWFTTLSGASVCTMASPCTWSQVLANYPNAAIHSNSSIPYGFVGVKAGAGGTGMSYFDGLTIAANQNAVTYDFEPNCSAYGAFNMATGEGFCTIQQAIDDTDTDAGDTISVTAGVFNETVNVNKTLTLLGAQSNVDGRTRCDMTDGESIVTGVGGGFALNAPNVVLRGFVITSATGLPYGAGVHLNSAYSGYEVRNNVLRENTIGLYPGSNGAAQTVIVNNCFTDNNETGASSGNGIYGDSAFSNASIEANTFVSNTNCSMNLIGFSQPMTNVSIAGNNISDASICLANVDNSQVLSNVITGSSYHGVQLGGGVDGMLIAQNTITNAGTDGGGWAGVRMGDFYSYGVNSNITVLTNTINANDAYGVRISAGGISGSIRINNNSIVGNVISGVVNLDTSMPVNAECNWWGAVNGPSGAGTGSGDAVFGNVDFNPWLLTSALNSQCSTATLVVQKVVSGTVPLSAWQFAGPTGTFTLPAAGGSITLTDLPPYGTAWVTETIKPAYLASAVCDNGSTGSNAISVPFTSGITVTCTFTNVFTLPDTSITSGPPLTTNQPYATFVFTGTDLGETGSITFECSLNNSAWAMCSSPKTYTGLSSGVYTFTVRALDGANNADSTPASFTWLVDQTAPQTSITSPPSSPTSSASATLVFTGSDAGSGIAYFEYRLDGGSWISTTSTTVTYTGLSNGSHQFDVRAVDNVGNIDPSFATATWTVDAIAPNTSISSAPASLVLTSTATLVFTGTDAGGSGVAYFEYTLNGGATVTTTGTMTTFTGLADGAYTFTVAAVDNVGNADATPASANWTVDTQAPETTITITPTTPTSSTAVSIAFTGNDSGSGVASFMCSLDGITPTLCVSPVNLIGLSDGAHTFTVYAIDNVGNADLSPASVTWVVDATAPDTSITSSPASQTNTASATFVFTGTDIGTGVAGFECKIDAGAWASCSSPKSYTGLSEGTHTFEVRALDAVSNIDSTPASFTWLVDTTAPDAIITIAPAALISSTSASVTFTATDGAGSGVASFKCKLNTGGYSACTSPITYTGLSDGLNMIDVLAIDNVGNVETSVASAAFTVDATPPTTTIDLAPPAIDSSNASFAFSGGDGTGSGVSGFECKLDTGAWAACASPAAYVGLSAGSHTFEVRAVDNAGNADATPSSHTWTVDGDLPNTEITPTLPAATTDTNVTIVFTGTDATTPAGALTFECSFDSSPFAACTSPFTQSGLAQGSHTFAVRTVDDGNNVDPSPATATWLVDTAAPDTNITLAPPAITSSNSAVIFFIGTDALAPAGSLTFECSVDGAPFAACTSPLALTSLASGTHTVTVQAKDTAGNVDPTPATTAWLVDATAPDTFIMTGPANPTSQTGASFTFSSTGSLSAVTYECKLDGGAWAACNTPHALAGLGDGSHTLQVRATSAAGLSDATPASLTWVVDAAAPDTTITAQPPAVSGSSASFSFSGNDGSGTGVAGFECRLDSGTWAACTSPQNLASLSDGSHTFSVRARDNAGNTDATPASVTWTVDSNLPETVLVSTPAANSPSNNASFTFLGTDNTAPASAITFECRLDGGAWAACTSPKSYTGLSDGPHTFEVRSVDNGGNADPTPASFTWTVNTGAPDTVITSGPMTRTFAMTATFAFTGSDAISPASDLRFECRLDGGAWGACSSPQAYTNLPSGVRVFEVRAIDPAGNVDETPARFQWAIVEARTILTPRVILPMVMRESR
jgi:hypothetical protein